MLDDRGIERMVLFSDAVVAIAITLLALPLIDIIPTDDVADPPALGPLLVTHLPQFGGFLLGFALIGRFWIAHTRLFHGVERGPDALVVLNLGWLAGIVLLAAATSFTALYPAHTASGRIAFIAYCGMLLVISALLTSMMLVVRSSDRRWGDGRAVSTERVVGGVANTVAVGAAFLLGALLPAVSYYALLLLFAPPPIEWIVSARIAARRTPVAGSTADDAPDSAPNGTPPG